MLALRHLGQRRSRVLKVRQELESGEVGWEVL